MSRRKITLALRFRWRPNKEAAALKLAEGCTAVEVATELGISRQSIWRWSRNTEFSAEVDRLSLMIGIASRAERLRIANRVIREKVRGEFVETDKDILDWIKFAQSETDGIKLNIDSAFAEAMAPVADSGQASVDSKGEAA